MRLGLWYWPDVDLLWVVFGAPVIAIPIFVRFGLYRAIIRFIGFKALWAIIQAVTLYALLFVCHLKAQLYIGPIELVKIIKYSRCQNLDQ
jgi:FlaA1/EpsC-like NDP-sugar epimerase